MSLLHMGPELHKAALIELPSIVVSVATIHALIGGLAVLKDAL